MSNHNIYNRTKTVLALIGLGTCLVAAIGFVSFVRDVTTPDKPSTKSSFLTARLEMPKIPIASPTPEGRRITVNGHEVFVNTRDCANRMAEEAPRLYGPLAELVGNNGLTVTVPRSSSVWQELEAVVLDAQIPAVSNRNVDAWADWKAETRPERERITANLLEALRRQEGNSLNTVPANFVVSLRAQHG